MVGHYIWDVDRAGSSPVCPTHIYYGYYIKESLLKAIELIKNADTIAVFAGAGMGAYPHWRETSVGCLVSISQASL